MLRHVRDLALPDCWVAAGFVRNAVWDHLHGMAGTPFDTDIDVIWFDSSRATAAHDGALEARLRSADGRARWSVKNQARMHLRNGDVPYASATDAMRCWPETATAVAVRLGDDDAIEIAAPLGLDDLFGLVVRPTARFAGDNYPLYLERIRAKQWQARWPRLRIEGLSPP